MFDYFNLITFEYRRNLDHHTSDMEYTRGIKEQYKLIDKQMEEEELAEQIPEDLTKEVAT